MDRIKLLNKPSSINNKHSFSFLILILVLSYVVNLYILIALMLGGIISMFIGVVLGDNVYGKIRAFRMIVLSWGYDIILLVILLLTPKVLLMSIILYYVLSIEVRRTPIDLIEGESELVSRFNTEYSGGEFVRFFLGEYLGILVLLVMIISIEVNMLIFLYCLSIYVRGSYPRKKYSEVVISI